MKASGRLVIVSNRLPIVLSRQGTGWTVRAGSGGLVTALAPILAHRGGVWIGWPGMEPELEVDWTALLARGCIATGYDLVPVWIPQDEADGFYRGFANSLLWPLFHDMPGRCRFEPAAWEAYQRVNERFAQVVAAHVRPGDFVWIHDYHLIQLGERIRELVPGIRIAFFLHIPFPPFELFLKVPWRMDLLRAFLACDLVGFQTPRDFRHFLAGLHHLNPGVQTRGHGSVVEVRFDGRLLLVGVFPIGIDYRAFHDLARSTSTRVLRKELATRIGGCRVVLGVDRLDYTKGIPERLLAFEGLLTRYPEHREKVVLVQLVVPSREEIPHYEELKHQIDRLVGAINGRFGTLEWTPLRYLYRSVRRQELLALYRLSRVGLVTPLKDGMNLVAKEYCACQVDRERGVLVLSEFAGAAGQLQGGALLVNPYDVESVTDALHHALTMPTQERRDRMDGLQEVIRRQDIFWWVDQVLQAAGGAALSDFPVRDEYVPEFSLDLDL